MSAANVAMDVFDDFFCFIGWDTSLVWVENDRLYKISLIKAYLVARAFSFIALLVSSVKASFLK